MKKASSQPQLLGSERGATFNNTHMVFDKNNFVASPKQPLYTPPVPSQRSPGRRSPGVGQSPLNIVGGFQSGPSPFATNRTSVSRASLKSNCRSPSHPQIHSSPSVSFRPSSAASGNSPSHRPHFSSENQRSRTPSSAMKKSQNMPFRNTYHRLKKWETLNRVIDKSIVDVTAEASEEKSMFSDFEKMLMSDPATTTFTSTQMRAQPPSSTSVEENKSLLRHSLRPPSDFSTQLVLDPIEVPVFGRPTSAGTASRFQLSASAAGFPNLSSSSSSISSSFTSTNSTASKSAVTQNLQKSWIREDLRTIAEMHASMMADYRRSISQKYGDIKKLPYVIDRAMQTLNPADLLEIVTPQIRIVHTSFTTLVEQLKTDCAERAELVAHLANHYSVLIEVYRKYMSTCLGENNEFDITADVGKGTTAATELFEESQLDYPAEDEAGKELFPAGGSAEEDSEDEGDDNEASSSQEPGASSSSSNEDQPASQTQKKLANKIEEQTETEKMKVYEDQQVTLEELNKMPPKERKLALRKSRWLSSQNTYFARGIDTLLQLNTLMADVKHDSSADRKSLRDGTPSGRFASQMSEEQKEQMKKEQAVAEQIERLRKDLYYCKLQLDPSLNPDQLLRLMGEKFSKLQAPKVGSEEWFKQKEEKERAAAAAAAATAANPPPPSELSYFGEEFDRSWKVDIIIKLENLFEQYFVRQRKAYETVRAAEYALGSSKETSDKLNKNRLATQDLFTVYLKDHAKKLQAEKDKNKELQEKLAASERMRENLEHRCDKYEGMLETLSFTTKQMQRTYRTGVKLKPVTIDQGVTCDIVPNPPTPEELEAMRLEEEAKAREELNSPKLNSAVKSKSSPRKNNTDTASEAGDSL